MPPAPSKQYAVTVTEAAERLGVHVETVRRWARSGRVPARRNISRQWMFSLDDLDELPVHVVIEDGTPT